MLSLIIKNLYMRNYLKLMEQIEILIAICDLDIQHMKYWNKCSH